MTGSYTFYISGDDGSELLLSPDASPFGKLREAWSCVFTAPRQWDKFSTQRSRPVTLQAGQSYYIEVLHKEGGGADHVALAWQPPGQPRALVPASAFTADIPESDDPDGDFLPTDWELLTPNGKPGHALDPADNGWSSATDGQLGDPDQDGLTNLDEFQLGTHPRLADTDGDGWSDKDERDRYRSNPLVSNAIQPGPPATIGLITATDSSVAWDHRPDGSAVAYERRGWTDYPVTVAPGEEGIHEIVLTGGAEGGSVRSIEKLPISFRLDSYLLGRHAMVCLTGQNTTLTQLTPWLTAGTHTLRVENHNVRAGCNLRINSLTIQRLGGPAADGDTLPLWVREKLEAENRLTRLPTTSRTSPAFIEGVSSWNVQGSAGISPASSPISFQTGPDQIFYANIPLDPAAPTDLTLSMQNGALIKQHSITWTPTNILGENPAALTVRKGDILLLTSWQGESPSGTFTLALTTDPALKAPVSGSFTGHLPTAADTAPGSWPAADPRLIGAATGTMQGSWIPTATAATAYHLASDSTGATFQLQFRDSTYTKVAKVRVENTPDGLKAWQIYAKYKSGNWLGQNFDTLAGTASAPAGSGGYGVTALSLRFRHAVPSTTDLTPAPRAAAAPLPVLLEVPGTHTLTTIWTPADGSPAQTKTLPVTVKSAEFGPDFIVQTYNRRTWTHTGLAGVELQPSSTLVWVETTSPEPITRSFTVDAYEPGLHPVLARLPETGEILAKGNVNAFMVARVGETADAQIVEVRPDGTQAFRFTVVADDLPQNVELRLSTYYQGAVFSTGSRELVIHQSELTQNGIVDVIIEWTGTGDPRLCHSLRVNLIN